MIEFLKQHMNIHYPQRQSCRHRHTQVLSFWIIFYRKLRLDFSQSFALLFMFVKLNVLLLLTLIALHAYNTIEVWGY